MPEDKLDFAPSKGLAALEGLFKGVSDVYKQRKEQEAKRIQQESALFRQLWPTLFQEQGRQRRWEQEQEADWRRLMFGEAGKERRAAEEMAWEKEKFGTTTRLESIRDEIAQMRWEVERGDKLEENRWQRAMDELKLKEQELKRVSDEALALQQLIIDQKRLSLEERKETREAGEFGKTFGLREREVGVTETREERAGTEFGERTEIDKAAKWRGDVVDLQTKTPAWSDFQKNPKNLRAATELKTILDALEARRMDIAPEHRPSARELPDIELGESRFGWIPDIPSRLIPREEPTTAAPAATEPVSMEEINAIKAMDKASKDAAYTKLYPRLKAMGKTPEEIAKIESYLGIK